MFRLVPRLVILALLIGLSACGTSGSVDGHGSENGGIAHLRFGLPF